MTQFIQTIVKKSKHDCSSSCEYVCHNADDVEGE